MQAVCWCTLGAALCGVSNNVPAQQGEKVSWHVTFLLLNPCLICAEMLENVCAFPTVSKGAVFQVGAGTEYQCDTLMSKTVSGVTSYGRFWRTREQGC